jgi:uncharacterized membrane protein
MDVLTAVITAEGDQTKMTTENAATTDTAAAVAEQGATVAPEKAASKKTASAKKSAPKGRKGGKGGKPKAAAKAKPKKAAKTPKNATPAKAEGVREGTKTAKVLDLLRRPNGATMKELLRATGWQPHSLRGFLSGTVGKKLRLTVTSTKGENGERTYSLGK